MKEEEREEKRNRWKWRAMKKLEVKWRR